jgi:hypothetical protein
MTKSSTHKGKGFDNRLLVQEADGSPTGFPRVIKFPNGSITDNGDGSFTFVASPATYTPSNVSADRSFDADSTDTAELADVLGTLIADLQAIGILK